MQRRQMVFHLIQQIHLAKENIEARIGLHVLQQRVNLYPRIAWTHAAGKLSQTI
jgi:hypothetical protein